MKKYKITILLSAFLFLSCSAQDRNGALRLMIWGDAAELETVRFLVQGFESSHPHLKVKVFSVGASDYNRQLQALFLNRQSPDVMYVSREWLTFYASREMIQDLQPFIHADAEFDFNDFYPEIRNSFFHRERPYAISKDFTPFVLYYNQDLFEKARLSFPNKKWTWKDFLAAARTLTRDEDGDGKPEQYGFVTESWLTWVLPWIWQAGGNIVDETGGKSVAGKSPYFEQNVRATEFLYDLIYGSRVAPEPTVTDQFGTSSMFLSGRAAMCVYGRWMSLNFKQIREFRWNVAPLPRDKKRATVLATVGYAVSRFSKKPKDSWELIKYLTGLDGQAQVAHSGLAVPARKSVAQSANFLKAASLPKSLDHKIFLEVLDVAQLPPAPRHWPQMEEEFNTAMNLIFRQHKPVRESLLSFHNKLDTILQAD